MRAITDKFTINGRPMLVPDTDVTFEYEDLDAHDAGRDERGVMHRLVVRSKVGSWTFSYSYLTEEEKQYMESLFGSDATFRFGHPARDNAAVTEISTCYRSKYAITWKNARTGLWSGYAFSIIQC